MKLLAILLFFSIPLFGQSDKKIDKETLKLNSYLRVASDTSDIIFCGYTRVHFFINTKRVILNSPYGSVDLEIVVRQREYWLGEDELKNTYRIISVNLDGDLGFIIEPEKAGVIGFAISRNPKLCEQ